MVIEAVFEADGVHEVGDIRRRILRVLIVVLEHETLVLGAPAIEIKNTERPNHRVAPDRALHDTARP